MGAIGRERAAQVEDFQIARDPGALLLTGQSQLGYRQAADGADHAARPLALLGHPGFQRQAQIVGRA